jgi:hypothetical protein
MAQTPTRLEPHIMATQPSRPGATRRGLLGRSALLAMPAGLAGSLAGCATPPRLPAVPAARTLEPTVLGIPDARFFFVRNPAATERAFTAAGNREAARLGLSPRAMRPVSNLLAVSGGGEDGAFGAGLLCGWTQHGTRPEFNLVTGVSTGALTAPFAFLGPAYDDALRDVYTNVTAANVAERRNLLNAVFNDALADTAPLFKTISRHLDETMMSALARAHDDGRLLLIGTTNLDAQTPVIWNIGAIAKSGHPKALDLVRRILLASAAIPGAFPPVMIDVELDGERFQEMHVDGGAFAQAFLYPQAVGEERQARIRRRENVRDVRAYIIRNARLDPGWATVERRTLGIVGRAISTMIFASGFNDVVRMYNRAEADRIDFNLAYIGEDFTNALPGPFDRDFMRALFEYGFEKGKAGFTWAKRPPVGLAADTPNLPPGR